MSTLKTTPTLAVVLTGAVVAGLALALPADTPADDPTPPAAAAGAEPDAPSADPAGPTSAEVVIADFAFTAPVVAPGATVTVRNSDGAPHTVTADDGAFDTGTVDGGDTVTFTAPTEPGTYAFSCAIHPSMRGELVVRG